MEKKQKIVLGLATALLVLNFFCWREVFVLAEPAKLKVDFFSVGQGDSEFIETPGGNKILIDGGPDSTVLEKLAENMPFWDRGLDLVVLTHPDSDHMNGLIDVLQKYRVDNILWTGILRDGADYQKWLKVLSAQQKSGAKIIFAKAGEEISAPCGPASGRKFVFLNILNPISSLKGQYFKEDNDTGVVLRLIYGKESFLFSADIDSKEEQKIVDAKTNLRADVLKVAHHGSKYSSSNIFLAAVDPQIAVISDGKNNQYHFPTSEVLQRLQNFGIKVLRTDTNGDVKIVSDGNSLKLLSNY